MHPAASFQPKPPKLRAVLVMNLKSRKATIYGERIQAELTAAGIVLDVVYRLKHGQNLDATMRRVMQQKPALVIVAGGDGTVSDAVDHLAHTNVALGVLPLGTTNNFARSLGLPLDITGAIAAIVNNPAKRVDLGSVNGDLFANIAGIGLSAEVAQAVTDKSKKKYGRFAYAVTGLRRLVRHKHFHAVISSANNNLRVNIKTHQLIIANGRYHAGKVIAADAKPDSRELVVFKLGGTSRLSVLWHLLDFYLGKRSSVKHTSYFLAKAIRITTDRPVTIELDGETKEYTPARIAIKPAALLVRH